MALEVKKQTVEIESVVWTEHSQVSLQAEAMVSGAGRDAVEVLMEDAYARIAQVSVQTGRVQVEGAVICQAAYRQGEANVLRAVEARAPLQHSVENEAILSGMNAAAQANVIHVETGFLNGRILFRVTVEICCTVTQLSSQEIITGLNGIEGAECRRQTLTVARCAAEAEARIQVSETLALPPELGTQATLMDFACVQIDKADQDLGGAAVEGKVLAEALITGSMAGKPAAMVKYPMPFRQLVQMPEWLSEQVHAVAAVESIRSELIQNGSEMALRIEAGVVLRVRAVQQQTADCVVDAYAAGDTDVEAERQSVRLTTEITCIEREESIRGTVPIAEGMPPVGSILACRGRVAALPAEGETEGLIEVCVLYMPSGGEKPVTVRDVLHCHMDGVAAGEDAVAAADVVACEGSALMSDRIEMRCTLRLRITRRQQAQAEIARALHEQTAQPKRSGIVICWPSAEETAWDVGRRYRVPQADVLREMEAFPGADRRALVLKI